MWLRRAVVYIVFRVTQEGPCMWLRRAVGQSWWALSIGARAVPERTQWESMPGDNITVFNIQNVRALHIGEPNRKCLYRLHGQESDIVSFILKSSPVT